MKLSVCADAMVDTVVATTVVAMFMLMLAAFSCVRSAPDDAGYADLDEMD